MGAYAVLVVLSGSLAVLLIVCQVRLYFATGVVTSLQCLARQQDDRIVSLERLVRALRTENARLHDRFERRILSPSLLPIADDHSVDPVINGVAMERATIAVKIG